MFIASTNQGKLPTKGMHCPNWRFSRLYWLTWAFYALKCNKVTWCTSILVLLPLSVKLLVFLSARLNMCCFISICMYQNPRPVPFRACSSILFTKKWCSVMYWYSSSAFTKKYCNFIGEPLLSWRSAVNITQSIKTKHKHVYFL